MWRQATPGGGWTKKKRKESQKTLFWGGFGVEEVKERVFGKSGRVGDLVTEGGKTWEAGRGKDANRGGKDASTLMVNTTRVLKRKERRGLRSRVQDKRSKKKSDKYQSETKCPQFSPQQIEEAMKGGKTWRQKNTAGEGEELEGRGPLKTKGQSKGFWCFRKKSRREKTGP